MSYRSFLILMVLATVASLGGWFYILFNVNPNEAGVIGFILFYVTLFAACVGLLTLFGIIVRVHLRHRQPTAFREVRIAFRHAVWLSLVSVVCLALSAQGWLNLWWFLLLLAVVGGLEYGALLIQESRRS
jgi:hypothetical protein